MQITSIQITRRENTGTKLKATVNIVLDDMIVVHDIKVLDNCGSIFLAMPSKATKSGTFKDIVHPINQDVRKSFEQLIIGAYNILEEQKCTKMELRFSSRSDISLFEQTCSMFEIASTSTYEPQRDINGDAVFSSSDKAMHGNARPSADDELLKWLES